MQPPLYLRRHGRFFAALVLGLAAAALAPVILPAVTPGQRILIGVDLFSAVYLALMLQFALGSTPAGLRLHAADADEGVPVLAFLGLAVVAVSLGTVYLALNDSGARPVELALALGGIPLGWAMLQTVVAFHYAQLYYGTAGQGGKAGGLRFEGTATPGAWEFLYYAFTVGMTAQVSDTVVTTTLMRKTTLAHSVLSFFYNTVILALAVNAAVNLGK